MLDELLAAEGVSEITILDGRVGFMALHGGLETATFEIAEDAANACGASLYSVRQPWSMYRHIPSIQFDPTHSEALTNFLNHVGAVISLHGFSRPELDSSLLLGGSNRTLARRLAKSLGSAGFDAIEDLEAMPAKLRGVHGRNPVNLTEYGGVQIEMGLEVRKDESLHVQLIEILGDFAAAEMRSLCLKEDC